MQIVITGSESMLGQALVRQLLGRGTLPAPDGSERAISRIVGVDRDSRGDLITDDRLEYALGDYEQPRFLLRTFGVSVDCIFHLDALLAGLATTADADGLEQFLGRGLDTTRALLDACTSLRAPPRVVFAGLAPADPSPAVQADAPEANALEAGAAGIALCESLLLTAHHCGVVRLDRVPLTRAQGIPGPKDQQEWAQALVSAAARR